MSPLDLGTGLFELGGAAFNALNVRRLWKDRQVKGVAWQATAFFTAWGAWNFAFYPGVNMWFAFAGDIGVVAVNVTWLLLFAYFRGAQA